MAFGLALILEGAPYFISPQRMKNYMETIRQLPESGLRSLGLMSMLFGLLLVYLARYVLFS